MTKAAWLCPGCHRYHAPHVDTCPVSAEIKAEPAGSPVEHRCLGVQGRTCTCPPGVCWGGIPLHTQAMTLEARFPLGGTISLPDAPASTGGKP